VSDRPRLRDLGLDPGLLPPGPLNAITDVPGVLVGHTTLAEGDDVRTGVTAIPLADRDVFREPLVGAVHVANGFGKSVGLMQVQELGRIETPIAITNTLAVWTAAEALVDWTLQGNEAVSINPVVGECNDSHLNDIVGRHVTRDHVLQTLKGATDGPVAEGNVGAGTGMSGFGYKAGIGTSSRIAEASSGTYTVGVLVVCNTGAAGELMLGGLPVGRELPKRRQREDGPPPSRATEDGSIIMVVATDAPLSARQLTRVVRRTTHGLARTGAISSHGSGDVAFGFSTASPSIEFDERRDITLLFRGTVEATDEAIGNSILRCETMRGRNGVVVEAIPVEAVKQLITAF
jgi:D-aminopeptidase